MKTRNKRTVSHASILLNIVILITASIPLKSFASSDACYDLVVPTMECTWGINLITPANDTRQNLTLLIKAYYPDAAKSDLEIPDTDSQDAPYACNSNNIDAVEMFSAAVDASSLPADAKGGLKELRNKLNSGCNESKISSEDLAKECQAFSGGDFCTYLNGASELYHGDAANALKLFKEVAKSGNILLKETSQYLTGRVAMIAAQKRWDGYSPEENDSSLDQELLKEADLNLDLYLKQYPDGRYAASARGLKRRALYLRGDRAGALLLLEQEMIRQLESGQPAVALSWVGEIDIISLGVADEKLNSPVLGSVRALQEIRSAPRGCTVNQLSCAEYISTLAIDSSRYPGLKELLNAALLVNSGKDAEAMAPLGQIPPSAPKLITDSASRLKAQAYGNLGEYDQANAIWTTLFDAPGMEDTSRGELIKSFVRSGKLEELFFRKHPAFEQIIFAVDGFLSTYASETSLKKIRDGATVNDDIRRTSQEVLLQKYLLEKSWDKFLKEYAAPGVDVSTTFGEVVADIKILSKKPEDVPALVNYSAFLHSAALTSVTLVDPEIRVDGKEEWLVENFKPYDAYKEYLEIVQASKFRRIQQVEPQLLSLLIKCFHVGSFGWECERREVDESVRKGWFQRLHSKFPNSKWAKETKYYY